jgi:hypothetical protein
MVSKLSITLSDSSKIILQLRQLSGITFGHREADFNNQLIIKNELASKKNQG